MSSQARICRSIRNATLLAAVLAAPAALTGCAAGKPQAFQTPEAAVDALIAAVRPYDEARVEQVLGSDADDLLGSGDDVADQNNLDDFLAAYDIKHACVAGEDGSMQLIVGETDWPMPIPLVRDGDSWRFDIDAGIDEILSRRIGRNELSTIEVCRAIVDAQEEYKSVDRDGKGAGAYARHFLSHDGTHDGLFWENKEGEPESPLGPFVEDAREEGYGGEAARAQEHPPYHGYRYRILDGQGQWAPGGAHSYLDGDRMTKGFAVVAWPASYGDSGIMTFVVNHCGIVYQCDLGKDTDGVVAKMTAFDPGSDWTIAE